MAMRDLIPRMRSSRAPVAAGSERANPMLAFQGEVNRLFDEFWRDFDRGFGLGRSLDYPHVEMSETDKEIKVEAELPGMDEKDIEVLLTNGVLTLRGEKRSESDDNGRRVSERFYGRFERQIALPVDIREDKVKATFKKGVLTLTLPKSEEAVEKVKRITIDS